MNDPRAPIQGRHSRESGNLFRTGGEIAAFAGVTVSISHQATASLLGGDGLGGWPHPRPPKAAAAPARNAAPSPLVGEGWGGGAAAPGAS
jgi:hypothetical protein